MTTYRQNFIKQTRKKKKYGNKTQNYNGRWYHSIKEARYAEELDWLKKSGDIISWEPQVKIDLRINGKHITNYYCDFRVVTKDETVQYHEVKGFETPDWRLKWAMLTALKDEILEPGAELIVIK